LKKFGENAKDVVQSIIRTAAETESTANTFNQMHSGLNEGQQRYFRFDTPRGLGEIGLDESSEAGLIADMTNVYLQGENTYNQIRLCSKIIADRKTGTASVEQALS